MNVKKEHSQRSLDMTLEAVEAQSDERKAEVCRLIAALESIDGLDSEEGAVASTIVYLRYEIAAES